VTLAAFVACATSGRIKPAPQGAGTARPTDEGPATSPSIQFDGKGANFTPWLRLTTAQIRRNWYIPEEALSRKGRVVVTFHVHRNGAITKILVLKPSAVTSFNGSAFHAIAASSPFAALPVEYPEESAFFTVTFYFNEPSLEGTGQRN
jgi:TonB family protein